MGPRRNISARPTSKHSEGHGYLGPGETFPAFQGFRRLRFTHSARPPWTRGNNSACEECFHGGLGWGALLRCLSKRCLRTPGETFPPNVSPGAAALDPWKHSRMFLRGPAPWTRGNIPRANPDSA